MDANSCSVIFIYQSPREIRHDKWQRSGAQLHRSFRAVLSRLHADLEFPSYKFSSCTTVYVRRECHRTFTRWYACISDSYRREMHS